MQQNIWVNYQYQLLRYQHDLVTGEFVNLGIVYFDDKTNTLLWRFEDKKYSRVSNFFGEKVHGGFVLAALKQLKLALQNIKNDGLHAFKSIETITKKILPPDNNGWYFSEVKQGRHFDHSQNFEELFARVIAQYQDGNEKRHDDTYAWKNVYKKYFDHVGITPKLQQHLIKTDTDSFNFQHAYKNGVWHCLQSLSFDLKHEGSIKDKIYRWNGIARELLTADEPMNVYLLSVFPESAELSELLKKKLNIQDDNVKIRIVSEIEAASVALELKSAMDACAII